MLVKLDLESNCPCTPTPYQDEMKGCWYMDVTLPFGLRSGMIFMVLADG